MTRNKNLGQNVCNLMKQILMIKVVNQFGMETCFNG